MCGFLVEERAGAPVRSDQLETPGCRSGHTESGGGCGCRMGLGRSWATPVGLPWPGEWLRLLSKGSVGLGVLLPLGAQCILAACSLRGGPAPPTPAPYSPRHLFLPWVQEHQPAQRLLCRPVGWKPEGSTGPGPPGRAPPAHCPLGPNSLQRLISSLHNEAELPTQREGGSV